MQIMMVQDRNPLIRSPLAELLRSFGVLFECIPHIIVYVFQNFVPQTQPVTRRYGK